MIMNLEPHTHKKLLLFCKVSIRSLFWQFQHIKDCLFCFVFFFDVPAHTCFPLCVLSSLFALLSKKHNKVLEQATQSLRGRQGDNAALPDYVSSPHKPLLPQSKQCLSCHRYLSDFTRRKKPSDGCNGRTLRQQEVFIL